MNRAPVSIMLDSHQTGITVPSCFCAAMLSCCLIVLSHYQSFSSVPYSKCILDSSEVSTACKAAELTGQMKLTKEFLQMADFSGDLIDHMIEGIGPGSAWLNDTHLDPANTTPLFGGALGLQYHIAMDGDPGYMIVPEAIPQDQAQRIAEGIHEGLQPTESFDNRFVYQVTPLAHEMIVKFTKV